MNTCQKQEIKEDIAVLLTANQPKAILPFLQALTWRHGCICMQQKVPCFHYVPAAATPRSCDVGTSEKKK